MFELINLAGTSLLVLHTALTSYVLYADANTSAPPLGSVVVAQFHEPKHGSVPPRYGEDGKPAAWSVKPCIYTALVVPYDRTWPLTIKGNGDEPDTMLPPEPGKIEKYAYVVYKKECPDTAVEPIFAAGEYAGRGRTLFNSDASLVHKRGERIDTNTVDVLSPSAIPQYVSRAMDIVANNAAKDNVDAIEALKNIQQFAVAAQKAATEAVAKKQAAGPASAAQ